MPERLTRRELLLKLFPAVIATAAVPEVARTFFLPPRGGWPAGTFNWNVYEDRTDEWLANGTIGRYEGIGYIEQSYVSITADDPRNFVRMADGTRRHWAMCVWEKQADWLK